MASFLFLMLALAATPTDPLDVAEASYQRVVSYRVTVRSRSDSSKEILRYFFKRPGFVRMEFIEPHNGAILVYNPRKKEARLRPFGFMKPLVLTLRPGNRLITSSGGHRIDASDFGAMLGAARKLRGKGKITTQGYDFVGGRKALLVAPCGRLASATSVPFSLPAPGPVSNSVKTELGPSHKAQLVLCVKGTDLSNWRQIDICPRCRSGPAWQTRT